MAKMKWTSIVLDDLQTAYDYIAHDSLKYADRLPDRAGRGHGQQFGEGKTTFGQHGQHLASGICLCRLVF